MDELKQEREETRDWYQWLDNLEAFDVDIEYGWKAVLIKLNQKAFDSIIEEIKADRRSFERKKRRLIIVAEIHPDDNVANKAMQDLRTYYDETFFYCNDCDGLVTTKANCCMGQPVCDPL